MTGSIKRQLTAIGSACQSLQTTLANISVTEGERARRRDMVGNLVARMEKAKMDVAGGATDMRGSLMAGGAARGGGRSQWGTRGETADTVDKDNADLLQMQNQIMQQQDQGLDLLAQTIARQKELGQTINRELDEQMPLLDRLGDHVDSTTDNVQRETKRVIKLTRKQAAGSGFLCLIFWIIAFALFAASE